MNELERHIETLLLSSDCVVVPDFGGFMAHHIEARFDEADNSFIPPHRTLGFNPKLKINDSLLAHSYIEAYDISYPDAMNRISEDVAQLQKQLSTEGFCELHGIGTLSVSAEGNMDFTPCEAGVLTPELYGLCSFEMKPIQAERIKQLPLPPVEQTANAAANIAKEESTTDTTDNADEDTPVLAISDDTDSEARTISIRVAWLRNAVAIAAAVLAFFLITTPVSNSTDSTTTSLSSFSLAAITDSQQPKQTVQQPVAATQAATQEPTVTTEPEAAPVETEAAPVETEVSTPVHDEYVVVLASHVARANAEDFVKRLHQKGYTEARVVERNHAVCVFYGSYDTHDAAYQAASQMHSDKELEQAWVLKIEG